MSIAYMGMSIPHMVRSERIQARRSSNSSPGTATSAIWKIVLLEWLMTFAPIFMSLSWMLPSDQRETLLGRVKRRRKFPRSSARMNRASLTWFDVNLVHDSLVQVRAYFPP